MAMCNYLHSSDVRNGRNINAMGGNIRRGKFAHRASSGKSTQQYVQNMRNL